MKYSRYQRNLHIEKVTSLLKEDPALSARSVFRILNNNGEHLCRSYVNDLVADGLMRIAEEVRRERINISRHIEWRDRLFVLIQELRELRLKMEALALEYPEDLEPRY